MIARLIAIALAVVTMSFSAQAQDRFGGLLTMGMALTFGQAGIDLPDDDSPGNGQRSLDEELEPVDTLSDAAAVLSTNAMTSATAR